ncbi:hypothetical protein FQN57_005476 [Myotisia sp. PD_48]|nr:hypothetical protein FQN57_005476 [Myotisia sp. PD_48]
MDESDIPSRSLADQENADSACFHALVLTSSPSIRYQDPSSAKKTGSTSLDLIRQVSIPSSMVESRLAAASILTSCRSVLTSLELNRMRRSRSGLQAWTDFWNRIYQAKLAEPMAVCVRRVFYKIDGSFKSTFYAICEIIRRTGSQISRARSDHDIEDLLEEMEMRIRRLVSLRQIRAITLLERLRVDLERIPLDICDEKFEDLMRGIFALDAEGNYHPGDKIAELNDRRQVVERIEGQEFISSQPDLILRPGFTPEFSRALYSAAVSKADDDEDDDDHDDEDHDDEINDGDDEEEEEADEEDTEVEREREDGTDDDVTVVEAEKPPEDDAHQPSDSPDV